MKDPKGGITMTLGNNIALLQVVLDNLLWGAREHMAPAYGCKVQSHFYNVGLKNRVQMFVHGSLQNMSGEIILEQDNLYAPWRLVKASADNGRGHEVNILNNLEF